MFKSILPKRIVTPDFTMLTPTPDTHSDGKENNNPAPPGRLSKPKPARFTSQKPSGPPVIAEEIGDTSQAFEKLLDDLQIPSTLRPKLATMDATVKAAMLKSSQVMAVNSKPTAPASPPRTPQAVRKTRSTDSIGSPKYDMGPHLLLPQRDAAHTSMGSPGGVPFPSMHMRGVSVDGARHSETVAGDLFPASQVGKDKDKSAAAKNLTPAKFFGLLSGTSSTQLEVETVKKLRMLLRNESASWSQEFLRLGGYSALLTRLNEILEVEWREEQHDDQVLHELLRCFKALSTSSIGCFALRSSCPTPFVQLISLLYSDKKPGDVATRQLIVDLLLILFELYPLSPLSSPSKVARSRHRETWQSRPSTAHSTGVIDLPAPHTTLLSLLRALLLTPAPAPSESPATPISPHAFIESLHKPRIYKTYLGELSDICRDYFWVFCHPSNTVWLLDEVDEANVEKPRAPGGMTGGVEFEAMAYLTTHFRFLNAFAKTAEDLDMPPENELSAYRLHADLFLSGLERIILIARKASTTYYPTLHLELARYVAFTARAQYELPWTVTRLLGLPPAALCKPSVAPPPGYTQAHTQSGSPSKRPQGQANKLVGGKSGVPTLPSPKKIEALKFD